MRPLRQRAEPVEDDRLQPRVQDRQPAPVYLADSADPDVADCRPSQDHCGSARPAGTEEPGVVGVHIAHGPLHVLAQHATELGVFGQVGVVEGVHETGDEAVSQIVLRLHAGVQGEHARLRF